jgi:2-polyprenyl-6-methoxyphenol hydroxylase-like FAD-dependent oxidoreductase
MHPDRPHYDVVVVGARAAGAATAMLLARAGLRVLVVDRSRYGADTLSTHALLRGGVLQLHRWGLLDRVVDAGTPPVRRTTFCYGADEVVVDIGPAHGVDALYAPRRTVLDPLLVDAASNAGAEVRYGVTVTGVRRDRGGRVIGVDARDDTGGDLAVEAGLVIGADGVRSAVARHVGARFERVGLWASAVVYGHWSDVVSDGYEWIFRPDACAGVIPTNGGQVCVFVAARPSRVGRGGLRVLDELLDAASPAVARRVRAGSAPTGVRTFAGQSGFARRAWGPGWALVGDAGYWKDPLIAHGLSAALRDAELLARAVVSAAAGEQPEHQALAAYQATRDSLSEPLFTASDAIAGQRWSDGDIEPLLRQVSKAVAQEVAVLAALDGADVVALSRP